MPPYITPDAYAITLPPIRQMPLRHAADAAAADYAIYADYFLDAAPSF